MVSFVVQYDHFGWKLQGAWEINKGDLSLAQNAAAKQAFEKAVQALEGYTYEPIALLGTQAVAGTNYAILVKGTPVIPDAEPVYSIITIYADLDGNAEITDTKDLTSAGSTGGFIANDGDYDLEKNEDAKAAFAKAAEDLIGTDYEPIALIALQVTSGTNYQILVRSTAVSPDALPEIDLMTISMGLDGNVDHVDVDNLNFSSDQTSNGEQIAAPFHTVESMAEAKAETGYEVLVPNEIAGLSTQVIVVYDDGLIEVNYHDEGDTKGAYIRKAKGTIDNVSGDYNNYSTDETKNGIHLRGNEQLINVAEWNADGFSYCVSVEAGIAESDKLNLVASVK